MKKLLIVDGNSILNRAFYGIRPLSNSEGLPTNAIYGMMTMLKKHLDAVKPDYAVIAYDLKAKTFRHKMCNFYKANRKPMPEDLAIQLPYAKECSAFLGFHIVELEGFEADDVIGTVTRLSKSSDVHSYVLTGDRDSLQLINDNTSVILVKNKEDVLYNESTFVSEYGVTPTQYIDVKAIMGDSSDNIPGVAGIGEKGAFKLISEFGSLDKLYEGYLNSSLSQGMKDKLTNGKEMAYVSKTLATIILDAPINKSLSELTYNGFDTKNLSAAFSRFEFSALIKKFGLEGVSVTRTANESTPCFEKSTSHSCGLPSLKENDRCSVYFSEDKAHFYTNGTSYACEIDCLGNFLSEHKFICHDVKSILKNHNICAEFDTMLAGYVISPGDASYALDTLSSKLLGVDFDEASAAQIIYSLYELMLDKLTQTGTLNILTDIEIPLAYVLSDMEKEGFMVDLDGLNAFSLYLTDVENACKERIYMLAGEEFNINSPKQLGEILFEKLMLPHGKKTKTGYSTNAEILEELASEYQIVREVLEYRKVVKLNGTYCQGLKKVADENGCVHTTFNQTVAVTGRLSSTEPNLQNIPIKTELGRELRKFFITKSPNRVLIDADYSQIELKVLAHMSNDEVMINAFKSGADIHTITASEVFGVSQNEVTPEMRKRAKAVNFGIVYGIGSFSLSKDLGITLKEAKQYIESYFMTYPKIRDYIDSLVLSAKENGYAKTLFGRIRYIPELKNKNKMLQAFGERAAMNSPIQGTAADIIKIAMINVDKALKASKIDARLILQVHDELIVEADKSCCEAALKILKEEMENAILLSLPLTAEAAIGKNWFDAK